MRPLLTLALCAAALCGQALDPAKLLQLPTDTWPLYNGDYSGRRFSPLSKINTSNIASLTLAWVYRINPGGPNPFGGGVVKSTPVLVDGVMYFTIPDQVYAVDARSGREIWHYQWQSKGGIHIGNRGVGVYGRWLYFETPDCNLVSLNLKDGKERWHKSICDLDQMYYASVAPVVIDIDQQPPVILAALNGSNVQISSLHPTTAGSTVVFAVTGLGDTSAITDPSVLHFSIGGEDHPAVRIAKQGRAPFALIQVVLASDVPQGSQVPVTITWNGATSAAYYLSIGQ